MKVKSQISRSQYRRRKLPRDGEYEGFHLRVGSLSQWHANQLDREN